jgi:acetyl esterase/lipase
LNLGRLHLFLIVFALQCGVAVEGAITGRATAQAALPAGVKCLRDLEYIRRGDMPLRLDLYLPEKSSGKIPVVVWIHGGGWNKGSKDNCPAKWLAAEGFAVASIEYRLSRQALWPAQMDDCRAAVRWLRANAAAHGLDADRIGVWGGSAGGHLAALMGTLDGPAGERVQAVCDWYGPSDLLTMPPNVPGPGRTRADLAKANGAQLLGGIVMDMPDRAKSASALHHVSQGDPPFLIMHGDADPQVPLDQSQRLHAALRKAGVPSRLETLKGAGHGGKDFDSPQSRRVIREFFERHLEGRGGGAPAARG